MSKELATLEVEYGDLVCAYSHCRKKFKPRCRTTKYCSRQCSGRSSVVREPIIDGDVTFIPLTQGKVAVIDTIDLPKVEGRSWGAWASKGGMYASAKPRAGERGAVIKMHRVIMGVTDPQVKVDHIDHDTLNNRRSNLRLCTQAENARNVTKRSGCSSKYKGVYFDKSRNNYQVFIKVGGSRISLGRFKSEVAAAEAYDLKAKEVHGQFANLNFGGSN